jgi:hypothetical protein
MDSHSQDYRLKGSGGCITIDFDYIFDEMATEADYVADETCEQCVKRTRPSVICEEDEDGNCIDCTIGEYPSTSGGFDGEESSSPHGVIFERVHTLCSRMVIYRNATATGGSLSYEDRIVFRSRIRPSLPYYELYNGRLYCHNPPKCDPGNKRVCCSCTYVAGGEQRTTFFRASGPYRDCTRADGQPCTSLPYNPNEYGGRCFECTEFAKKPMEALRHMVTPCNLRVELRDRKTGNIVEERRGYIMGYERISEDWWFFGTPEYDAFETDLAQNDPLGGRKHTIVAHFEMQARPINCCTRHCPSWPDPGTSIGCGADLGAVFGSCTPCHNLISTTCTSCTQNLQWLSDPEDRQKKVRILSSAGFTLENCGSVDLQELCDKWWAQDGSV